MKGIEEEYELPREAEDDVWSLTERERKMLGIQPLPKTLYESIQVAENSELLAETLGEHVYDYFLRNKRAEWEDYRGQVSAWERDQTLPVLCARREPSDNPLHRARAHLPTSPRGRLDSPGRWRAPRA